MAGRPRREAGQHHRAGLPARHAGPSHRREGAGGDSGYTDKELLQLDKWIRAHTTQRFGPVREVEKALVLEVEFDTLARSTRHKSGVAMRFPRIHRIRWDKPAEEADTLDNLLKHIEA